MRLIGGIGVGVAFLNGVAIDRVVYKGRNIVCRLDV